MALSLRERGIINGGRPTRAREHLATMLMLSDEQLAREFVRERLEPLEGHEQLLETLEAWLDHQRHTPRAAAQLHVHPQTVRYRLAKLRELLGDALERADQRFELELALRVRRALSE
jgi:DNA-binding PucR family transcriptional regulator